MMVDVNIIPLWNLDDGIQVGYQCACGGCQPTASILRDDPQYERHDPHLADGPCCCGRFFVVGYNAQERAEEMSKERQQTGEAPHGHTFQSHTVTLPWGGQFPAIIAELRQ